MLQVHKDIILSELSVLVEKTDLNTLVPELLNRNVFNEQMINRILNSSCNSKRQKTDLYIEILNRGPRAFAELQAALASTNHSNLAEVLKRMDRQRSSPVHRSTSLNSVGSNRSPNSSDGEGNDGPCYSIRRKKSPGLARRPDTLQFPTNSNPSGGFSQEGQLKTSDLNDSQEVHSRDPRDKIFNPPAYRIQILDEYLRASGELSPDDIVNYISEKYLPVNVKHASKFEVQTQNGPGIYKMDSLPRGHALIINNLEFDDAEEFPPRRGADNDGIRLTQLVEQFHFVPQYYKNKTKTEMEEIVNRFSMNPDLENVDCVWVIIMSHGEEGETPEDSHVVGVDGIGYKTADIVRCFYNDCCKAAINKPKIFFFPACRGNLTDPGVTVGNFSTNLSDRIATDGRRMGPQKRSLKIRTQSDIFIAHATPPGVMANRDEITGSWFIQAVVDVFSEHAWNNHLDGLLKMVDDKIRKMNNLYTSNFQAVSTKTFGWHKNLFFHPGIYRNDTGATVRIGNNEANPQPDEGMDVVDSEKSPNGVSYLRLKDDKDEEGSDDGKGKEGCLNLSSCKMS